jgi:hypothetical protein
VVVVVVVVVVVQKQSLFAIELVICMCRERAAAAQELQKTVQRLQEQLKKARCSITQTRHAGFISHTRTATQPPITQPRMLFDR